MFDVGIIGAGFVGTAVETGLQNVANVKIYDKFKDTESLFSVVEGSQIIFLCLPTPMSEDGSCDTSILEDVVEQINNIAKDKILVIKSTVPPGTTQRIANRYVDQHFFFNPEFLTEKRFIEDFLEQSRIVIGSTKQSLEHMMVVTNLYVEFVKWQTKTYPHKPVARFFYCKSEEAEMAKYMANCFLATKVIFCNEMKQICDKAKIDYNEARKVFHTDSRIGPSHTQVPGPDGKHGFGGPCFSKDTNALIAFAYSVGADPLVLEAGWTQNLLLREEYEWENLAQVNGKYTK
jgi:nucleotide sugar dehydrogenase